MRGGLPGWVLDVCLGLKHINVVVIIYLTCFCMIPTMVWLFVARVGSVSFQGSLRKSGTFEADPHHLLGEVLKTTVQLLSNYRLKTPEELREQMPRFKDECVPIEGLARYDGFCCLHSECTYCTTQKRPDWANLNTHLQRRYPRIFSQFSRFDEDGFKIVGKEPFEVWNQGTKGKALDESNVLDEKINNCQEVIHNANRNVHGLLTLERRRLMELNHHDPSILDWFLTSFKNDHPILHRHEDVLLDVFRIIDMDNFAIEANEEATELAAWADAVFDAVIAFFDFGSGRVRS